MLDFRIYTFIEVCKYMNFTRAAEQLNITQPTVSQHIRWLENVYGVSLFSYVGKKMALTESGRQILNVATTMVHDEKFLKKAVETIGKRDLRLGATLTVGETIIAEHKAAYLQKHPEDRISVVVSNTRNLAELLNLGEIDFALVEGYFEKKEFDYQVYSKENYVCACGPNSYEKLTKGGSVQPDLSQLLKERLLVREPGSGTREILEKNLKEKNYDIEDFFNLVQISNIHAIKSLAAADMGITFLYERAIQEEVRAGKLKLLPIEDFLIQHEFAFIWRKGSVFAPVYREFFQIG